jgi:hypothetical protein
MIPGVFNLITQEGFFFESIKTLSKPPAKRVQGMSQIRRKFAKLSNPITQWLVPVKSKHITAQRSACDLPL